MVRPSGRTRSRKRATKPLPGGRTGTQFKNEIAAPSRCSSCGQLLGGKSSNSPLKSRKSNLSRRRIFRLYGGQLCHNCLKAGLRKAARAV